LLAVRIASVHTHHGVSFMSAIAVTLHCSMGSNLSRLQLGLDDLCGELHYARRHDELGRLALLCYCEVRHWARKAGETALAEHAAGLVTEVPRNRAAFLTQVDALIEELDSVSRRWAPPVPVLAPYSATRCG
jgi:hypothetical protein